MVGLEKILKKARSIDAAERKERRELRHQLECIGSKCYESLPAFMQIKLIRTKAAMREELVPSKLAILKAKALILELSDYAPKEAKDENDA